MKTDAHTRLDIQLRHDLNRYYESGKKATDQERSVLHQVLRGIENGLEILDSFPIDAPGLPTLDITVPDEDTARWNDRPKLRLVPAPDRFETRELEDGTIEATPVWKWSSVDPYKKTPVDDPDSD